jgi:hypothetical protein
MYACVRACRETGKRLAWELARQYGDPLPDPDLRAKIEAVSALYEQDDNGVCVRMYVFVGLALSVLCEHRNTVAYCHT